MNKEIGKDKSVIISGYYGFDNCGDEAILMVMIQELSKHIPPERIIVLSQTPQKTKTKYKVNAIHRLNIFLIMGQLRKAGIFISGGGGLLQDVSGRGLSIVYYLGLIVLAQFFKVPVAVYGQGIGPVKKPINRRLIKFILAKVKLILVRDEQSQKLLQKLGIKKDSVQVNADTSFLLLKEGLPDHILKKYKLDREEKIIIYEQIGFVLRNCEAIKQDYEQKITLLANSVAYLIEKQQANIFFVPFQPNNDLSLYEDLRKIINQSEVDCLYDEINPAQMLSLFSKFSLVIGMRFHAIIFATICNIPFIAIDYDPKVRNYVNGLGLSELLLNVDQISVKSITDKLKYVKDNRENITSTLCSAAKEYQNSANAGVNKIISFMEEYYYKPGEEFTKP